MQQDLSSQRTTESPRVSVEKIEGVKKWTHHFSGLVYSTGLWETPSLLGTKTIAVGTRIETGHLRNLSQRMKEDEVSSRTYES